MIHYLKNSDLTITANIKGKLIKANSSEELAKKILDYSLKDSKKSKNKELNTNYLKS